VSHRVLAELPPEWQTLRKPPERVWYRGDPALLERPKVSIVGTRRPLAYTRHYVRELARGLARRGVAVVSGAAMGVDAQAHLGAGPEHTIAVTATGIDRRYPAVNRALIEQIEERGLVLTRFEPGSGATRWGLVLRNELVVALGKVLVIAEADPGSGSLRSAEYALKQGKEIWVLPHRLGESEGTRQLLREGAARPIEDLEGFLERFGREPSGAREWGEWEIFCQGGPTLEEAVARFGDRVYEEELAGTIRIERGRIVPL